MRALLTAIAVVLSLGAAFDLLITLDLAVSDRPSMTIGDYMGGGAPLMVWAGEVLVRTLPERVIGPVMVLPPDWFFPVRAAALGLCAAVLFALVQARRS